MSATVENHLKTSDDRDNFVQKVHYIPCKIDSDGPANVEKYFETYVAEKGDELTASFRGHPLDGVKLQVPEGYTGIQMIETKRPLGEDVERKFQVVGSFKQFVNWNWDKKPSRNDNIVRAMDWMDLCEAIHGD